MPRPRSLGEDQDLVLVKVELPMPPTRQELFTTLSSVISSGGVQRLLVEVGKPIQVSRLVEKNFADDLPSPVEEPATDLWNQVTNSTMEEFMAAPDWSPFEVLFHAFNQLQDLGLVQRTLYAHDPSVLKIWLGQKKALDHVFGAQIIYSKDVPEDATVLAGMAEGDLEGGLGLRLPLDLPVLSSPQK